MISALPCRLMSSPPRWVSTRAASLCQTVRLSRCWTKMNHPSVRSSDQPADQTARVLSRPFVATVKDWKRMILCGRPPPAALPAACICRKTTWQKGAATRPTDVSGVASDHQEDKKTAKQLGFQIGCERSRILRPLWSSRLRPSVLAYEPSAPKPPTINERRMRWTEI